MHTYDSAELNALISEKVEPAAFKETKWIVMMNML